METISTLLQPVLPHLFKSFCFDKLLRNQNSLSIGAASRTLISLIAVLPELNANSPRTVLVLPVSQALNMLTVDAVEQANNPLSGTERPWVWGGKRGGR